MVLSQLLLRYKTEAPRLYNEYDVMFVCCLLSSFEDFADCTVMDNIVQLNHKVVNDHKPKSIRCWMNKSHTLTLLHYCIPHVISWLLQF